MLSVIILFCIFWQFLYGNIFSLFDFVMQLWYSSWIREKNVLEISSPEQSDAHFDEFLDEQNDGSAGEESEYHKALICEGYDLRMPLADHVPDLDKFGDGNEDQPESSKRNRGDTIGSEQNKKRKISWKFVVKYNSLGIPVGEEAIELATYIGVLARTSIPILYND